jgi:hypothetical protein
VLREAGLSAGEIEAVLRQADNDEGDQR